MHSETHKNIKITAEEEECGQNPASAISLKILLNNFYESGIV